MTILNKKTTQLGNETMTNNIPTFKKQYTPSQMKKQPRETRIYSDDPKVKKYTGSKDMIIDTIFSEDGNLQIDIRRHEGMEQVSSTSYALENGEWQKRLTNNFYANEDRAFVAASNQAKKYYRWLARVCGS